MEPSDQLEFQIMACKISGFEREYKFHPKRKWKFDFAHPAYKLAVECEGGIWINGRHNRGKGFLNDCYKYNEAVLLGWKVLRVTPCMITKGEAVNYIINYLEGN